jgi:hypothetical protein
MDVDEARQWSSAIRVPEPGNEASRDPRRMGGEVAHLLWIEHVADSVTRYLDVKILHTKIRCQES